MPRPLLLPALVAAAFAGILLGAFGAPAAGRGRDRRLASRPTQAPLAVTIDRLTPSALPRTGPVRVSGSVTNVDDETWTTINLYPFVSGVPITSTAELAEAADTDAEDARRRADHRPGAVRDDRRARARRDQAVLLRRAPQADPRPGSRACTGSGCTPSARAPPGATRSPTVGRAPSCPWCPEGTSPHGRHRAGAADPARRTPRRGRADRRRAPTGPPRSRRRGSCAPSPSLGVAAGDRPLTWLVDPAVTDAVTRLTAGNPERSLAPTVEPGEPDGDESESPSSGRPRTAGAEPRRTTARRTPSPRTPTVAAASAAGSAWLDRLHTGLEGSEVLGLPYGDLDVSAAAAHDPDGLRVGAARGPAPSSPRGVCPSPRRVASPSGYLSPAALQMTDDRHPGPASPTRCSGAGPRRSPETDGHSVVVTSSEAASGGPGPGAALSPLAVRQRIVSEAALRLLTPGQPPLVVVLPSTWAPTSSDGFWDGLDLDWLQPDHGRRHLRAGGPRRGPGPPALPGDAAARRARRGRLRRRERTHPRRRHAAEPAHPQRPGRPASSATRR